MVVMAIGFQKPEKAAEIRAKLTAMRRAKTMATTSVSRAGLAANDACASSSYVAPTTAVATTVLPASTSDATQSRV